VATPSDLLPDHASGVYVEDWILSDATDEPKPGRKTPEWTESPVLKSDRLLVWCP